MGDIADLVVVVIADGAGVPIIFPVHDDGVAVVLASRLSLRFQLREDSICIDEEVFDPDSGIFIHIVG